MNKKCNKCDERGYIADKKIKGAFSSCECGWAIREQEKLFKDFSIADLVGFKELRRKHNL